MKIKRKLAVATAVLGAAAVGSAGTFMYTGASAKTVPISLCRGVGYVDAPVSTGQAVFTSDFIVCRDGHRYTLDLSAGVFLNAGPDGPGGDTWQSGPTKVTTISRTPNTVTKRASAELVDFHGGIYATCYRAFIDAAMNTITGRVLDNPVVDVQGIPCVA